MARRPGGRARGEALSPHPTNSIAVASEGRRSELRPWRGRHGAGSRWKEAAGGWAGPARAREGRQVSSFSSVFFLFCQFNRE